MQTKKIMAQRILLTGIIMLVSLMGMAQEILYSNPRKEDNMDINFEILGKVGGNYIVYKGNGGRHNFQVFDKSMQEISNSRIKFLDDRLLNVDFVVYPDYFFMIYQRQRNSVIYCNAVKFDNKGEAVGDVVTIDTTKIGLLANNKIYSTAYSEDKKKILVYKMRYRDDEVSLVTKRLNEQLQMTDSTRYIMKYNERRDIFSDLQVANDGSIVFARQRKQGLRENINDVEIFSILPGSAQYLSKQLTLSDKFIDEVKIKIDNLNKNYLVNSFFFTKKNGNVDGLYAAVLGMASLGEKNYFIPFPDSIRSKISDGRFRSAFDDMFLRNIFLKRDGSFLLVAEDYSSFTNNSNWNRWDYLYGSPYSYSSYNIYAPGYTYYRPFRDYGRFTTNVRYNYDNMLLMDIDSSLKPRWMNIIFKSQEDDNSDNFLSYGTLNAGAEIYFLFIEKVKNAQVISSQALSPAGMLTRNATLKSREKGYQFMPRLAKQVGLYEAIIPAVYRGRISFAKVNFLKPVL